jgi:hypothetical protein
MWALWPLTARSAANPEFPGWPQRGRFQFMSDSSVTPVMVVGFDMTFWTMVRFLIKLAIASIPAGIVVALIYVVLGWIWGALLLATHHTAWLK